MQEQASRPEPAAAPLHGLKVIDVSVARAGPTAVRLLADGGADVIRVEQPGEDEGIIGGHTDADFVNLHRNKRAMTLNLKNPKGLEIFRRLVQGADVLVENFRPGVTTRLGIDYPSLSALNPRLVYASISGYGQDGPYAERGAVDQVIQGAGGLMSITGFPGSGPLRVGIAITDMAAGHQLAVAILLALRERDCSGRGQWVHVSLLESLVSFLDFQAARWTIDGQSAIATGNEHPTLVPQGTYAASDGFVNIAASSNRLWQRLCTGFNAPELAARAELATRQGRTEHRDEVNATIGKLVAPLTRAEVLDRLAAVGVPCGPVNSIAEVFADPQAQHLRLTTAVDHPVRGRVEVLRPSITLSRTPVSVCRAAPLLGEHTAEILSEMGYTAEDLEAFEATHVTSAPTAQQKSK